MSGYEYMVPGYAVRKKAFARRDRARADRKCVHSGGFQAPLETGKFDPISLANAAGSSGGVWFIDKGESYVF
jgi:hypothetical protein